ncbi:hypothetical protein DFR70_10732 [Nocardia tenerifensis]|uniref:Uncharacterized protein n=1 Tax=Nocardia tenerifensis TaxID=228006 RepID=A0A318JXX4_9NOCA|nr:hypothetical protein [Nocardia tenerifensis]PXX62165.1 hypothetical protein DFR70_10732 [Nocardia tenerifensis]
MIERLAEMIERQAEMILRRAEMIERQADMVGHQAEMTSATCDHAPHLYEWQLQPHCPNMFGESG